MGLPPTEPRESCRPAVRLRVVGGSGGNGSLAGTESILASCHESSRSKTFTRTQSRCMAPLTLNLSALPRLASTPGDRRGGRGCRSRPQRGTGRARNRTERAERAKACPVVVVRCRYSVIRFMAPWRRPPRSGPADRTSPEAARPARAAVDGRCRGWSADHAPRSAVFRPSAVLSSLHHTPPPYNPLSYTFGVRGSFASCIFFR